MEILDTRKLMPPILIPLAVVGALTVVLASMLIAANRRLSVAEDPRIDEVLDLLPSTNCGACGYPGCRAFAEALVAEAVAPGKCTVSAAEGLTQIASYLGVAVGGDAKRVARLACAGGSNVARNRARYSGLESCAAATRVGGGGKGCSWGCLGLGDCDVVCEFDAIHMDEHNLPVVDVARCTACGDCVTACPKDLFSLETLQRHLWVACRSLATGTEALEDCDVACDACGRCAVDAPTAITIRNNLPVVGNALSTHSRDAIERCPTGAIVWLSGEQDTVRGSAAKRIIRQEPRAEAPT